MRKYYSFNFNPSKVILILKVTKMNKSFLITLAIITVLLLFITKQVNSISCYSCAGCTSIDNTTTACGELDSVIINRIKEIINF